MLEYQGEGEKQNQGELAGCSRLADKCNQQRNWTALNGVLKLVELVLRILFVHFKETGKLSWILK